MGYNDPYDFPASRERADHVPPITAQGKGQLQFKVGKTVYNLGKVSTEDVAAEQQQQLSVPVMMGRVNGRCYWRYQNRFYNENEGLDARQVHALLMARDGRRARQIDRAEQMLAMGSGQRSGPVRGHISDEVKHFI